MKKFLLILLSVIMSLSLVACGNGNGHTESDDISAKNTLSCEEMLKVATPMTKDDAEKSTENIAFAKSLIGNTYTFDGIVCDSIKEDFIIISFSIRDEQAEWQLSRYAKLYLPAESLIDIVPHQRLSLVGRIDAVEDTNIEYIAKNFLIVFGNAAIVKDRFESTGVLVGENKSIGNNSWNIRFPNNNVLGLVYFNDDVSKFAGDEITYSYKIVNDDCVDAYIVE